MAVSFNGCPVPAQPGSVDGTAFGPDPGLPFPDRTLSQLSGDDQLDGQIIVQLDGTRCLNGINNQTLLGRLQNTYPESMWTQTLLNKRLTAGRRQGRFCQAANNTWVLRDDMVIINYINQKFQGLSNQIIQVPVQQTTVAGSESGAYSGDLPCPGSAFSGFPQVTALLPARVLANLRAEFT